MNAVITGLIVIVIIHSFFIYFLSKYVAEFLNSFRVSNREAVSEKLKIGEKVPLFREKDHLNRQVILSQHKNSNTLLVFAGESCFYCKNIVPELDKISHEFNLRVIVIAETKINYKLTSTHILHSRTLFKDYKIKSVPSMLLVDDDSYLIAKLDVLEPKGLRILLEHHLNYKKIS